MFSSLSDCVTTTRGCSSQAVDLLANERLHNAILTGNLAAVENHIKGTLVLKIIYLFLCLGVNYYVEEHCYNKGYISD